MNQPATTVDGLDSLLRFTLALPSATPPHIVFIGDSTTVLLFGHLAMWMITQEEAVAGTFNRSVAQALLVPNTSSTWARALMRTGCSGYKGAQRRCSFGGTQLDDAHRELKFSQLYGMARLTLIGTWSMRHQ